MMTQTISAARWCAVHDLQAQRAKSQHNNLAFEASDRAIDYALSLKRPESPFLARNAFRNARHAVLRDRNNPLKGGTEALEIETDDGQTLRPYEDGRSGDATYLNSLSPDPEALLAAAQDAQTLKREIRRLSQHAERVLDDWLAGFPIETTAATLGLCSRQVKNIRRRIREGALRATAS